MAWQQSLNSELARGSGRWLIETEYPFDISTG